MFAMWASTVLRDIDKAIGDRLVRPPLCHQGQDFALALRKVVERDPRTPADEDSDDRGIDDRTTLRDPADGIGEVVEIRDPVLEQVPDAAGTIAHQTHGERRLDVLGQHEDADRCPVFRADGLRGAQTLVRVCRWHPDVDDRHIGKMLPGRRAGDHPRRRLARLPRIRRPRSRRATPSRTSIESSARTSRRVILARPALGSRPPRSAPWG